MALTKIQIAKLERALDQQYRSLIEEVRDALEKSENQQYVELIDRAPADTADQATGDALADLNLAIIDRHVQELRDIEASRARVAHGAYGSCADCGADIAYERLLAYPPAKRCIG
jgi:RNA polymerase-binding protein DksA